MDKLQAAIDYFEDGVLESAVIMAKSSPRLQAELKEQVAHFKVALTALKKQMPLKVVPIKKNPVLCKCCKCKTHLVRDDKDLRYCPVCGQALES